MVAITIEKTSEDNIELAFLGPSTSEDDVYKFTMGTDNVIASYDRKFIDLIIEDLDEIFAQWPEYGTHIVTSLESLPVDNYEI